MKKISIFILLIIPLFIMAQSDIKKQNKTNNNVNPYRIAIGFNPADFSVIYDEEKAPTGWMISMIEEVLTTGGYGLTNCPKSSGKSYVLVDTANPEIMKKYREVIERDNNDENIDPTSRITPHFITATHLVKGKGIIYHGCAMVNLRIEDRKGCIRAQKKITVKKGVKNLDDLSNLAVKAARSLHSQLCNPKFNEQSCSKAHYSDKLSCPYYFVITTKIKIKRKYDEERGQNSMVLGPKSLSSTRSSFKISKQIMRIETSKGTIKMMPIKGDAHSSYHFNGYRFNNITCKFEEKNYTYKDKSLNYSMAKLKEHNIGLVNNNKAIIILEVKNPYFRKKFSIKWKTIKNSGSWSGHKNYYIRDNIYDNEIDNFINKIIRTNKKLSGSMVKEIAQFQIDNLDHSQIEKCQHRLNYDSFNVIKDATFSRNIDVDVSIRTATKSEINLMKQKNNISSYGASKIKLSKFEKEPQSVLDSLQNSIYEDLSQKDKKAWDRVHRDTKKELQRRAAKKREEAIQEKKDLEEYNNLSMDDLELFTK